METYAGETLYAGDVLLNDKGKYQGVLGTALNSSVWLTDEADLLEEVDFNSRKNLLTENTIQLKKYELFRPGEVNLP